MSDVATETAFATLVRQHQAMVHALAYRMTGSAATAEDLAQETFLRAYAHHAAFRGEAQVSTWLYRIAMNLCLDWLRQESRRRRLHAAWAEDRRAHAAERGDPGITSDAVRSALLQLPDEQRAAIVLTVYDGLNHRAAAEILGCAEATVSWRVFAARRRLARLLAPIFHHET